MKHFFRSLLLLLATIWVVLLGYYAYILTTDTLSLPFVWQERQSGNTLQFVVAKPRFLISSYNRNIIDHDALIGSLTLDGKPFDPTLSWEGYLTISGEYVSILANNMTASSILRLDASLYNTLRTTEYRFPRDMILTESKNPKEFSVYSEWEERDRNYNIRLVGYTDLWTKDVRWYMHNDPTKNCNISDAWDSREFVTIPATEVRTDKDGQIETAVYHLDFDPNTPRLCMIAWVGGDFYTVEDRYLNPFTGTGTAVDVLSPEFDMQSRVEFQFSSDIYRDIWDLYSNEYIAHRKDQKTLFLKSLEIYPNVTLTEDNISLTPDRASIVGSFQEGKKYTIKLRWITDIYGRTLDTEMEFIPVKKPFLSLGLTGRKTIFRYTDAITAKMYSLKTPKNEYNLSLCQISLEWYARAERMIAENSIKNTRSVYDLLESDQISGCIKKSIAISPDETISPFDIRQFSPTGNIAPWLYILAFSDKKDVDQFDKFIAPRVFSIIDTEVTMKVDASGKMQFLVTDIATGDPRDSQQISLLQNITRSYTETWDQVNSRYNREYFPITNSYFSKAVSAGTTNSGWILKTKKENLIENDYNSLYWLSFEPYGDYEGRYSSFIATASGSGHFWYVVSTWNDGITGWNFWLKEYDYSWDSRPPLSAYIHTDRRLYLPGDKVYIHAILRKNDTKLTIPVDTPFQARITDPLWTIVKEWTYKANDYGSIAFDFTLPTDAHLGSYSINIEPVENSGWYYMISNSWSNFQVEVFKNPTFTAEVSLRSPDIDWDTLLNLREQSNTDPSSPWYSKVYESTFSLEWIVKAHYYNGQEIRNIPFSYRIYRNEHYDWSYWSDCFWWCYYEPSPEFYTEWTGTIDTDGFWFFRIPVNFSSFYSDYMYTAEVIIRDPMTGEEIVTPATLLAKIPEKYKSYTLDNPLQFTPLKRIISQWEKVTGSFAPQYGKWDESLVWKYKYELLLRTYSQVHVDDLRMSDTIIPTSTDTVVASGTITWSGFLLDTKWFKSGEYHLRTLPITDENVTLPETTLSNVSFYIVWDFTTRSHNLQVIPEKTIYKMWDTARVMITLPFTGGYVYITREKWGVIGSEYLPIEGNTMIREYKIDDASFPNMYIGAIAYNSATSSGARTYAVGYGEIITDLKDKKADLKIETNKSTYTNRETVDAILSLKNRDGKPLEWEITVMVVDESLIRLLGNIDLDIIPKFFQKFPFTMKTSLTSIGIERNRFLSRKWSNGWSGDKGWEWQQISSRSLFKNTAYYNASVRTDSSWKAKITFTLPDNVTDYRIIAIGQTRSSQFGVWEKTIQVRRDYTLEAHTPFISYAWDKTTFTVSAFNSTKKVTQAKVVLTVWSGAWSFQDTKEIIMNPSQNQTVSFPLTIRESWKWNLPYKITLLEEDQVLDSLEKNIKIPTLPIIESTSRKFWAFLTWSKMTIRLSDLEDMSLLKSRVVVRVSSSLIVGMDAAIRSLLVYPYGCIEQTISSTLPNALALKFNNLIAASIDTETAKKNLNDGVKKILRMQQFGGWKYWESDTEINTHVTPYVLRSLYIFRDLWVNIPQASIDAGIKYVEDMVDYRADLYTNDPDFAAEIFWTLAMGKSQHVKIIEKSIDPKKLSRHGYLAYAYGLQILGKYTTETDKILEKLIQAKWDQYWYWNSGADSAIYARLLLDRGEIEKATKILDTRLRSVDLSSYYVSTQEKIQLFYALFKHTNLTLLKPTNINIALRGEAIIADLSLTKDRLSQKIEAPRGKMWDEITLTRSSSSMPIYYELLEYSVPDDILSTDPTSNWWMGISREFERVDESRGIDKDGNYISAQSVEDTNFEKWQLYRATIRVKIPEENATWQHLTVEDFVPGWWRPIKWIFHTESRMNEDSTGNYDYNNYWSYVEARDDRILATIESGYGTTRIYTYYFRPEYAGEYLLPPVTAYFMYRPEIHAIGRYQKITVK